MLQVSYLPYIPVAQFIDIHPASKINTKEIRFGVG